MKQAMQVLTSSETNEWYTPPWITSLAEEVMGGIDLDPASCEEANGWIGATWFFDCHGLERKWWGRVWLNPPYGKTGNRSNQDLWFEHLVDQFRGGMVKEGMILTKTVPGYQWWERWFRQWPVCMLRERVEFIPPAGAPPGKAKTGTSIWYVAPEIWWPWFGKIWKPHGRVIYPDRGAV